jgi:hypothetical protein
MNWQEFSATAPELAGIGERRLTEPGVALIGTLRRDGSPRISPVEVYFVRGEPMLGMMWQSMKARDLLHDPRVVVHSATCDRNGTDGDFKLYGRAVEVGDAGARTAYGDVLQAAIAWRPSEPYHLFAVDVERVGYIVFGPDPVAMRWSEGGGLERIPHPEA